MKSMTIIQRSHSGFGVPIALLFIATLTLGICCGCGGVRSRQFSPATASSDAAYVDAAGPTLPGANDLKVWQAALWDLRQLIGMQTDDHAPQDPDDLEVLLNRFKDERLAVLHADALAHIILDGLELQKIGGAITDFLGLAEILWQDRESSFRTAHAALYEEDVRILQVARQTVNQFVQALHPGLAILRADKLRQAAKGTGIVVGVFDLFDDDLLTKQRQDYSSALIEPVSRLGNPPRLDHGNAVIDTILALAPAVTIVPVSADAAHYNDGFAALSSRDDIAIINISRGFAADSDGALNTVFSQQLQSIVKSKIITKAIGNTGTDLSNNLTEVRRAAHLGPVGSLASYDLALIRQVLAALSAPDSPGSSTDLLLLAVNVGPFADRLALSATIPGDNDRAQDRTFALPADGVYAASTAEFVSGSSFAAPMLAGLSALLLDAAHQDHPNADSRCQRHAVTEALKATADRSGLLRRVVGHGVPRGDAAWRAITSCSPARLDGA